MTTMTHAGRTPEFTLAWRLRLAIETAGISVQQMSDQLGYSRSTLSRWLNGTDEPRAAVMAQWALITEVDPRWLATGVGSTTPTPPTPDGRGDKAAMDRLTEQKRRRARRRDDADVTNAYPAAA